MNRLLLHGCSSSILDLKCSNIMHQGLQLWKGFVNLGRVQYPLGISRPPSCISRYLLRHLALFIHFYSKTYGYVRDTYRAVSGIRAVSDISTAVKGSMFPSSWLALRKEQRSWPTHTPLETGTLVLFWTTYRCMLDYIFSELPTPPPLPPSFCHTKILIRFLHLRYIWLL